MTILAREIEIIPVKENFKGSLDKEAYCGCSFCGKRVSIATFSGNLCNKLSGRDYYCGFCLRHNFYTKNNKNVLILTFRNILNHFYQEFYANPLTTSKKMYLSEIKEYTNAHVQAGLLNPTFSYDPSTLLWFIDFSRVGRGNKKIRLNDVLKTVLNILACFNLKTNITSFSVCYFYEKYETAIQKFYANRYRSPDRAILSPSIFSSVAQQEYKPFTPELLAVEI
jgi:hypothetical protein